MITRIQRLQAAHDTQRAFRTKPMPVRRALAFAKCLQANPAYNADSVQVRWEAGFAYGRTYDHGLRVVEYCRAGERLPREVEPMTDAEQAEWLDFSSL